HRGKHPRCSRATSVRLFDVQSKPGHGVNQFVCHRAGPTIHPTGRHGDNQKKLLVLNIAVQFDPAMAIPDLNATSINYLATFKMFQKDFWQGHVMQLPAGAGPQFSGAATVGTTTGSGQSQLFTSSVNGRPSQENYNSLVYPGGGVAGPADAASGQSPVLPPITGVLIEQGAPFVVILDPTQTNTPGTGFTTSNLTVAVNNTLSVGVSLWVYLCGVTFVAVV